MNNKKWDLVLMNPPYAGSLHLKFLEKVIEISDKVVSIQPSRWLTDPLIDYKKKTNYQKYEYSISKHISDFEMIEAKKARRNFGIGLMMDCGIFVCDEVGGYDYTKNDNKIFVENIIKKSPNTIDKVGEWNKIDGIRVKVRFILPSGDNRSIRLSKCGIGQNEEVIFDGKLKNGKSWTTLSAMNKGKEKLPFSVKFETENDAANFLNSFYTNFMIYYYAMAYNDQHVYLNTVPFMNDYTKPWTDERFYEYFDIDKDKQKEIEEYIKARE
jgi:hypothetical protein